MNRPSCAFPRFTTAVILAALTFGSHSVLAANEPPTPEASTSTASISSASVSSTINDFTNEDWLNGVYRTAAGFSIPANDANIAAFKPGAKVLLANGSILSIRQVQVGKNMAVWLEGPVLDGATVGYPHILTVSTGTEAPVPPKQAPRDKSIEYGARINDFTNEDWVKGVYKKAAGVSIRVTTLNRNSFRRGATVRLADGRETTVKYAQIVGSSMAVFLDCPPLDGNLVGYPKKLTYVAPPP
jgi:endoglucanase